MKNLKETINKIKQTVDATFTDEFKYFTIEELCRSEKAKECNIDNTPTEKQKVYMRLLIINILDPLREKYGKSIWVNSGFRSEELNIAVGGSLTSHHRCRDGYAAADITRKNKQENIKLFNLIQEMNLPFCQLILENGGQWVHVSFNPKDIRREVLEL